MEWKHVYFNLGRKPNLFSSSSSKNLDVTDGHPQNQETLQDLGDIVKAAQWRGGVQTLQRRKRENAVGLLWKAGMRSISSRVQMSFFVSSF